MVAFSGLSDGNGQIDLLEREHGKKKRNERKIFQYEPALSIVLGVKTVRLRLGRKTRWSVKEWKN